MYFVSIYLLLFIKYLNLANLVIFHLTSYWIYTKNIKFSNIPKALLLGVHKKKDCQVQEFDTVPVRIIILNNRRIKAVIKRLPLV